MSTSSTNSFSTTALHMASISSVDLSVANPSSQGDLLSLLPNHCLLRISDMMQKSTKVLEPFTTGSWTWNSDNLLSLEVSKER